MTKGVRRARVRFSGLGWSELYINGKKVSDDVLSPNLTDYSQEALYRTYDVTSFLKPGPNAIGVMLGHADSKMVEHYRHLRNEDAERKMEQIDFMAEEDEEEDHPSDAA